MEFWKNYRLKGGLVQLKLFTTLLRISTQFGYLFTIDLRLFHLCELFRSTVPGL